MKAISYIQLVGGGLYHYWMEYDDTDDAQLLRGSDCSGRTMMMDSPTMMVLEQ